MTRKQALAAIRATGAVAKFIPETGEYRVNVRGGKEATAAYTEDAEDAIGTAKAMVEFEERRYLRTVRAW